MIIFIIAVVYLITAIVSASANTRYSRLRCLKNMRTGEYRPQFGSSNAFGLSLVPLIGPGIAIYQCFDYHFYKDRYDINHKLYMLDRQTETERRIKEYEKAREQRIQLLEMALDNARHTR